MYVKGRPLDSGYVGAPMERYEKQLGSFWVTNLDLTNDASTGYAGAAAELLRRVDAANGRVGIEAGFMPLDAFRVLEAELPGVELTDATYTFEVLRAEDAGGAGDPQGGVGEGRRLDARGVLRAWRGHQQADALRRAAAGGDGARRQVRVRADRRRHGLRHRAPYDKVWEEGETLALDSGGNYRGYIGDVCRMAYAGEPDQELVDLLGQVELVQQAARTDLRPARSARTSSRTRTPPCPSAPPATRCSFSAHGMGIVSHEAPWLMPNAFPRYAPHHRDQPLEAGMVISIETELHHTERGFIKLEDTVAITPTGCEGFGDHGRGWNLAGR